MPCCRNNIYGRPCGHIDAEDVTFDPTIAGFASTITNVQDAIDHLHNTAGSVDSVESDPTGTGYSLISSNGTATDVLLNTIKAGTGVSIGLSGADLTISSSSLATVSSVNNTNGTGNVLVLAPFTTTPTIKTLTAGSNITLTASGASGSETITIASSAGGGGDLQDAYDAGNSITIASGTPVQITASSQLDSTYFEVLSSAGNPIIRCANEGVGNTYPICSIFSAQAQNNAQYCLQVGSNANALGINDIVLGDGSVTNASSSDGFIFGQSNTISGTSSNAYAIGQSLTLNACVGHIGLHDGNGGASTINALTSGISMGSVNHYRYKNGGGSTGYPWSSSPATTLYYNEKTEFYSSSFTGSGSIFTVATGPLVSNCYIHIYFEAQIFNNQTAGTRYQFNKGRYYASDLSGSRSISAIFDSYTYAPTTAPGSWSVDISGGSWRLRYTPSTLSSQIHAMVKSNVIRANL